MKMMFRVFTALAAFLLVSTVTPAVADCDHAAPNWTGGTVEGAINDNIKDACNNAKAANNGGATAAKQDTGNTSLGSIDTKMGEVQSSPTANTLLDRLKSLFTALTTGNTSLGSIDTKLTSQATGAKQDTGNTSLGSIDTKLTSQATGAKQDTGNTSLGNIDTSAGAQADAACGTDTGTCSGRALTKRLIQRITTLITNLGPTYGGTPITCSSGDVANTNAVCTLAGTSGKTTYITGFRCSASGATAALVTAITVAGVITGTMHYIFQFPAVVTTASTPQGEDFTMPIPASATNTAIVVTLPAGGSGNAHAACVAQGLQL